MLVSFITNGVANITIRVRSSLELIKVPRMSFESCVIDFVTYILFVPKSLPFAASIRRLIKSEYFPKSLRVKARAIAVRYINPRTELKIFPPLTKIAFLREGRFCIALSKLSTDVSLSCRA